MRSDLAYLSHLSVYLSVHLSVRLTICLPVFVFLFHPSFCLSVFMFLYNFTYISLSFLSFIFFVLLQVRSQKCRDKKVGEKNEKNNSINFKYDKHTHTHTHTRSSFLLFQHFKKFLFNSVQNEIFDERYSK